MAQFFLPWSIRILIISRRKLDQSIKYVVYSWISDSTKIIKLRDAQKN